MSMKKEVSTSAGVFELVRPKAGVRNRAMIKAETDSGAIRRVVFMTELLPTMINKRPESIAQSTPINQVLDSLEIEDYDILCEAADDLANPVKEDPAAEVQKKT